MKKRKLLSIFTALSITLSLSTPTFAANDNPPPPNIELAASEQSGNVVSAAQGTTKNFSIKVSIPSNNNLSSTVTVNTNYHITKSGTPTSSEPSSALTYNTNTAITQTVAATVTVDNDVPVGNVIVPITVTITNANPNSGKTQIVNSIVDTFTVNVQAGDTTAPVVTISSPVNNGYYNASTLPNWPVYNIVEANSFSEKVDGWDTTEGTHTVTVTSTDASGNKGSASATYTVDKINPTISTAIVDGGIYNVDTLKGIIQNGGGKYYTIQDANLDSSQTSASDLMYTEGDYTATIIAVDMAGNSTTRDIQYTVDNTAPSISFNFNDNGFYKSTFTGFNPYYNIQDAHLNPNSLNTPALNLTQGYHSFTVSAADLAGNSNSVSASYTIDDTAPTVTIKLDPNKVYNKAALDTLGDYYTAEDTNLLDFKASSLEKNTDGTYTATVTAIDKAGNTTSQSVNYTVDNTKPSITFDSKLVNGGFYKSSALTDIKASFFTATDTHLVSATASNYGELDLTDGQHTVSVTAVDAAGNETTKSIIYTIDNTPPVINFNIIDRSFLTSEGLAKLLDGKDYYAVTDNIGVVSVVADQLQTSEGYWTLSITAKDAADNESTKIVTYTVDNTAPSITGAATANPNAAGWYNSDVIIHFTASDALSGLASEVPDQIISAEGSNQSVIGTATDNAGNSASFTVSGINIDKTVPTITVENGGTYTLNQVVAWTASDALSGLATPSSGTIDTGKVGPRTQIITARDNAGNTVEETISFTVIYAFGGILQPINPNGTSLFKLGSTVPVKFQLKDVAGNYVSTAAATLSYAKVTDNVAGNDEEAVSTSAATIGNAFRYDSTANQYMFNLNTKNLEKGTYQLTINFGDSKSYKIQISLK